MKMKVKILVAALGAAGLIAPLSQALADTITGPIVIPPLAQSANPESYAVTYPVTVTLSGGSPQALSFKYNADGTWTPLT